MCAMRVCAITALGVYTLCTKSDGFNTALRAQAHYARITLLRNPFRHERDHEGIGLCRRLQTMRALSPDLHFPSVMDLP